MMYRRQTSNAFVKKNLPPPSRDEDDGGPLVPDENNSDTEAVHEHGIERHLTLTDLVAIGVGGTIGSGLFVLSGLVAHEYAGPSTVFSWAVSGAASMLSGCCYAELSARIPLPGAGYAYAFVAMGELPALLAAACLSLEYIACSAAVARSWADKVAEWLVEEFGEHDWIDMILNPGGIVSPLAFCIATAAVMLLLNGVKESKRALNALTLTKVSLVSFMVIVGAFYVQPSNWSSFFPFGVSGVFRGATATFFGYLGYDEVCCLAGEALNPKRNLPRAVLFTLVGVTFLYMVASLVLTGMQSWENISPVSGFPVAFYSVDADMAGQITALGELFTLPLVVLIAIMAQPRLFYALADDGLLPPMFRELDRKGNLWNATLVAGSLMIVAATMVPFESLNDTISAAVLTVLSITDSSLILLWHEPASDPDSDLAERLVLCFHVAAFTTSIAATNWIGSFLGQFMVSCGLASMIGLVYCINVWCPRSATFGGASNRHHYHDAKLRTDDGYFRTPLVPFWPCLAIAGNWYLTCQLKPAGILGFLVYLGIATAYYFTWAIHNSVNNSLRREPDSGAEEDEIEITSPNESKKLLRSRSIRSMPSSSEHDDEDGELLDEYSDNGRRRRSKKKSSEQS